MQTSDRQVVVVGGGFAGVAATESLLRYRGRLRAAGYALTLVSRENFHLFTPSLYEVATSEAPSRSIAIPFHALFGSRVRLEVDEVVKIDPVHRRLELANSRSLSYDRLILTAGAETNYFKIPGLREHSLPLKRLADAVQIREAIEAAYRTHAHDRKVWVAIGGGGFSGVELTAELLRYRARLAHTHRLPVDRLELLVVEGGPRLLAGLSERDSGLALRHLQAGGVKVFLESFISRVSTGQFETSSGERFDFDLLVWTGGVSPSPLAARSGLTLGAHGAVLTDPYLRLPDHPEIFAAGDVAALSEASGTPLPPVAEVAESSGHLAGANAARSLVGEPLRRASLRHSGYIVPLTGRYALAHLRGLRVHGLMGWVLQQLVFLRYLAHVLPFPKAWRRWSRFEHSLHQD